ncbi:MAG: SDR family NAD(P)-dependent oxidoreductase [Primorskyibacter sp.]
MGRLALITGGSAGIGAAIVRELGKAGHRLAFSYCTGKDRAQSLVQELTAQGVEVRAFHADFAQPTAARSLYQQVADWGGTPQVLVNNAGPGRATPLSDTLGADTMAIMQVNVAAPLDLIAAAAPGMKAGGVILNISSLNGRMPPAQVTGFAASKAALDAATRALALELGPRDIRVLGLAPGPIERDEAPRPQDVRDKIRSKTALPRFGTVQDVAKMAAFLVSDDSQFATGEIIGLHGGWH